MKRVRGRDYVFIVVTGRTDMYLYITSDDMICVKGAEPTEAEYIAADRGTLTIIRTLYDTFSQYDKGDWVDIDSWTDDDAKGYT
jgi:hypothetical protein